MDRDEYKKQRQGEKDDLSAIVVLLLIVLALGAAVVQMVSLYKPAIVSDGMTRE